MTHTRLAVATTAVVGLFAAGLHAARPAADARTVRHVLSRITFGPRPGDVERVQEMGLDRYIDSQLHPERLAGTNLAGRLDGFETLGMDSRTIAQRYEIPQLQALVQAQRNGTAQPQQPPATPPAQPTPEQQRANLPLSELAQAKVLRAAYSDRQLEEVLADFWFNHFNVDARKGPSRYMLTEYEREAIRPHVLGHFRDLLGATAKSPAMLFYLDNWMSAAPDGPHDAQAGPAARRFADRARQRRAERMGLPAPPAGQQPQRPSGLNENYGRELLELHTLGVDGGYTQKDVTEVARAFTGWTIQNPRLGGGFRFAPALHDDGEKVVLGHRIKAGGGEHDGEQVLDIVAAHPATARVISTKLARRFVGDAPPDALVDRMASTFRKTDGDLREVMRVLLTSREFLEPTAEATKVKNPFEFVVSALRATSADVRDARPVIRALQQLGMPLYQCQPPTGYVDRADVWVNTGALVNRMNVALMLASGQLRGISIDPPDQAEALVGDDLSDTTRATIARATVKPQAIALALGSPEFQRR